VNDNPRIAELRRRVDSDPASIAFAQLAEEYRREGACEQAIEVCRAGLAQYPSYLSARVTLGRALTELGRLDEARTELERVLQVAPDNVAARRALEELAHHSSAPAPASSSPPAAESRPADRAAAPPAAQPSGTRSAADDPAGELEAWLAALLRDRARRSGNASR
jgi:tetratricopeptide (TPR) repeat protein